VDSLGLAALGFIVGMVVVPYLLRWIALLHTTFGLHGGDFLGPPKRRLLWATPLIILVHPAPYFLVGAVAITVLAARGRISGGWVWLLVGFCAYAVFMAMMMMRILKARKRARTGRNA
jgi:hypothetical protein